MNLPDGAPPRLKLPRSVLVLIHTAALDVLLLKRTGPRPFWQSVTGSQLPGESLAQTALREVGEETGIAPTAADLQDWRISFRYTIYPEYRYRYPPGTTHNTEHVFALRLPAVCPVVIAPGENSEYDWLPFAEAEQRVGSWSNRDAIALLRHRANRGA